MIINLEVEGQRVDLDLGNLATVENSQNEQQEQKKAHGQVIQFASEPYQFALDLANLVKAESIQEAENAVVCWQPEESSTDQPGG